MPRQHTTTDPGAWQNDLPKGPSGENYRGKSDIRQPSGGIEFINTKNEEQVTFYYTGGAFLRFEKFATDLFVPTSYQTHVYGSSFETVNKDKVTHVDGTIDETHLGDKMSTTGDVDKCQKHGEKWLKDMQELHNMKRRFEVKRCKQHNDIDQAEGQEKDGTPADCPTEQIKTKHIYGKIVKDYWTPSIKAKCGHTIAELKDSEYEYESRGSEKGKAIKGGWECMTCWGDGLSPSSQDGEWNKDEIKKEIEAKIAELTDPLAESEKHFGTNQHPAGGTEVRTSNKNVVEHVGNVFNSMESYRKDPKGKLVPSGLKIDPFGAGIYPQFRETPLIEKVHVDPVPGGSYHKTVADKYTLTVGANGISMKTNGDVNLFGIQANILSERTTIHGTSEVIIGGERVDITGEVITLRPKKVERTIEDGNGDDKEFQANGKTTTEPEQQVLVDGNLNVGMNVIIAGGAHVEGELSVQHITAPCEYQITETDFEVNIQTPCGDPTGDEIKCIEDVEKGPTYADILPNCKIGVAIGTDSNGDSHALDVFSICAPNSVQVHPHHHWFKNIPLKLIRDNTELEITVGDRVETSTPVDPHSVVRSVGARNNFAIKNLPMPVKNSKTNNTVIEKFEEC
jgi:hypothetical protein|tara:strand:- start:59766 stop:61634 length:1869 start_codon:yes stop_codon:yes gene_type:complete